MVSVLQQSDHSIAIIIIVTTSQFIPHPEDSFPPFRVLPRSDEKNLKAAEMISARR
jgi:hypothetical protein